MVMCDHIETYIRRAIELLKDHKNEKVIFNIPEPKDIIERARARGLDITIIPPWVYIERGEGYKA